MAAYARHGIALRAVLEDLRLGLRRRRGGRSTRPRRRRGGGSRPRLRGSSSALPPPGEAQDEREEHKGSKGRRGLGPAAQLLPARRSRLG